MITTGDNKLRDALNHVLAQINLVGLDQRELGREILAPAVITVDVEIAWISAENQIIASLQTNVTPETVRTSEEISTPSGTESQTTESVTSGGDNSTTDYSYSEVGV